MQPRNENVKPTIPAGGEDVAVSAVVVRKEATATVLLDNIGWTPVTVATTVEEPVKVEENLEARRSSVSASEFHF